MRAASRRRVRAVLAFGVLVGTLVPAYFFLLADTAPFAWDFRAYHHAATLARDGRPFVGVSPAVGGGEWVYPPVTVVAFYAYTLVSWSAAYLAHAAVSVIAGLACAALVIAGLRDRDVRLTRTDAALVAAFFTLSTYPVVVLGQGQLGLFVLLALLTVHRALAAGRERTAGGVLALASAFKLFPLFLLVWFARRRAWRAIAWCVGATAALWTAGVAAFGWPLHAEYVRFIVFERSRVHDLAAGMSPNVSALTLQRPLAALFPDAHPLAYTALACLLLLPALAALYTRVETQQNRAVAYLGTLVVMLLVSPASNVHHVLYAYVPLVALLYTVRDPVVRACFLTGTALVLAPVQPAMVADVLGALGAPASLTISVVAASRAVLSVGSLALYGLLVILAGCVVHAARAAPVEEPATTPDDRRVAEQD
ncbi:glycosyltransferase family 87 protein [Salarchaeum japonicum]|uniref:Glycosyltransferase family 87 protein n=1 Tax=Salarchaeum japonicum TaxID=555573 RepID=A0AAV3T3G0_9EURY|nr:glycosyltransferase family 87 protein [Salarchaeum japonicum]